MWIAGLGTDAQTMRRRWRAVRQQISNVLSEKHGALLLADDGLSPLVVEGSSHAALMFGSLSPRVERADVVVLCEMAMRLTSEAAGKGRWTTFTQTEPIASGGTPWAQGYRLADAFHEKLDGDLLTVGYVDVEELLRYLEVDFPPVSLTDPKIRGVAMAGPQHRPGIAWNRRSPFNMTPPGRRFTLAHELCHVLVDHAVGRRLSMASGPWAPERIEQRANAFAAMLLMPPTLVQSALGEMSDPLATEAGVGGVAERLRTGFDATLSHLNNLALIDDIAMQRIRAARAG